MSVVFLLSHQTAFPPPLRCSHISILCSHVCQLAPFNSVSPFHQPIDNEHHSVFKITRLISSGFRSASRLGGTLYIRTPVSNLLALPSSTMLTVSLLCHRTTQSSPDVIVLPLFDPVLSYVALGRFQPSVISRLNSFDAHATSHAPEIHACHPAGGTDANTSRPPDLIVMNLSHVL